VLGYIPDPVDRRDYRLYGASAAPTETRFSWRTELTPVRDQGRTPTCVAFAIAALLEAFTAIHDQSPQTLSPAFIYHLAKRLDGQPAAPGTTPRVGLKVVHEHGCPHEHVVPFGQPITEELLQRAFLDGSPYRIQAYARLTSLNDLKARPSAASASPTAGGATAATATFRC